VTIKPSRKDRRHRLERVAANLAGVLLAAAAFGSSFRHVQTVAAHHGQAGWLSWTIAGSVELMSLVAISELSRARATGRPVPPAAVLALGAGLLMSAACNAATAHGSGAWPIVMALWPVVAYGLVVLIVETRPGRSLAGLAETVTASTPARPPASTLQLPAAVTPPPPVPAITPTAEPEPVAPAPASEPTSTPAQTVDRAAAIVDLADRMLRNPGLDLTWHDVHGETGRSKSWCEKVLAAARREARKPRLVEAAQ
jgi:hypothetical protein